MKKLILIPLLFLLTNIFSREIVISKDTSFTLMKLGEDDILKFEGAGFIRSGTITGGIIQAPLNKWIFDTSVNIYPSSIYDGVFSVRWYGAHPSRYDNTKYINKALAMAVQNENIRDVLLTAGVYDTWLPLFIYKLYKGSYVGVNFKFRGESSYWGDGGTVINYRHIGGLALGIQKGKGMEVCNLRIKGQFIPPSTSDSAYYNTKLSDFGSNYPNYWGIAFDWDGSKGNGGSTGCYVHDVIIDGFTTLIRFSASGVTFNCDNMVLERIQLGNARIGIECLQAQEKGNIVRELYSWGSIYRILDIGNAGWGQAGNWTFDIACIAGKPVEIINATLKGWYGVTLSNWFGESLARIGIILSGDSQNDPPFNFINCSFNFLRANVIGKQTILYSNSPYVKVDESNRLRYYGAIQDTMYFKGMPTISNSISKSPKIFIR